MSIKRTPEHIAQDILKRFDPDGEMGDTMSALSILIGHPLGRTLLSAAGVDIDEIREMMDGSTSLVADIATSVDLLGSWGWVPSGNDPVEAYRKAIKMHEDGVPQVEIDMFISDHWSEGKKLFFGLARLKGFGAGDEELHDVSWERYRLVDKALQHHVNGNYEASFLIALAQADGIAVDAIESKSTSGLFDAAAGSRNTFLDELTIAGMPEALQRSLLLFRENIRETTLENKLSRHGAFHGRTLKYDTKVNSTKALVLLIAVIEWAHPKINDLVVRRRAEREKSLAGNPGVDERGRRLDRRGFTSATEGLNRLWLRQSNELSRHGRFGGDLNTMFPQESASDDFLRGKNEIVLTTSEGGQEYRAVRQLPSGVFVAIYASTDPLGRRFYVGDTPPKGNPDIEEGWVDYSVDWW